MRLAKVPGSNGGGRTGISLCPAVSDLIYGSDSLRHFGWYDAYAHGFQTNMSGALHLFISREWHNLIARIMDVPATGHVNGGIHHHPPGSGDGFIHNDLNPVYFDRDPRSDEVVLPNHSRVSYTVGSVTSAGIRSREVVRCTALIYYTANPDWHIGDGGETALYGSIKQDARYPDSRVPPINNSMVLFNCTPTSFHAFTRNWRSERNSIVMWLHAPPAEMTRRFGGKSLVRFRSQHGARSDGLGQFDIS
jgi:2OG-Fe(II) oxygenase superfamily